MAKYWNPELISAQRTPAAVLKEAAAELNEETKGCLELILGDPEPAGSFSVIKVSIHAPVVLQYTNEIIQLHSSAKLVYPVTVVAKNGIFMEVARNDRRVCQNETDFTDAIQIVFNADYVAALLASLIAQSREKSEN